MYLAGVSMALQSFISIKPKYFFKVFKSVLFCRPADRYRSRAWGLGTAAID